MKKNGRTPNSFVNLFNADSRFLEELDDDENREKIDDDTGDRRTRVHVHREIPNDGESWIANRNEDQLKR